MCALEHYEAIFSLVVVSRQHLTGISLDMVPV